jgi:hypothetical protein
LTYVMFMLPIWRNGPLTSPCPWYFCAMHAIPPCPLIVMTTNLFALRHHFVFHYCACFALCIAQSYNVSFHHISTHLLPLSNAFTIALILLQHLHRWLITTIKYNLCKCFYNTWSKYVHCPIWRSCIACSLLVKITCKRNYFYLASLGRLFFNPCPKLPSSHFCLNVKINGDVSFLFHCYIH